MPEEAMQQEWMGAVLSLMGYHNKEAAVLGGTQLERRERLKRLKRLVLTAALLRTSSPLPHTTARVWLQLLASVRLKVWARARSKHRELCHSGERFEHARVHARRMGAILRDLTEARAPFAPDPYDLAAKRRKKREQAAVAGTLDRLAPGFRERELLMQHVAYLTGPCQSDRNVGIEHLLALVRASGVALSFEEWERSHQQARQPADDDAALLHTQLMAVFQLRSQWERALVHGTVGVLEGPDSRPRPVIEYPADHEDHGRLDFFSASGRPIRTVYTEHHRTRAGIIEERRQSDGACIAWWAVRPHAHFGVVVPIYPGGHAPRRRDIVVFSVASWTTREPGRFRRINAHQAKLAMVAWLRSIGRLRQRLGAWLAEVRRLQPHMQAVLDSVADDHLRVAQRAAIRSAYSRWRQMRQRRNGRHRAMFWCRGVARQWQRERLHLAASRWKSWCLWRNWLFCLDCDRLQKFVCHASQIAARASLDAQLPTRMEWAIVNTTIPILESAASARSHTSMDCYTLLSAAATILRASDYRRKTQMSRVPFVWLRMHDYIQALLREDNRAPRLGKIDNPLYVRGGPKNEYLLPYNKMRSCWARWKSRTPFSGSRGISVVSWEVLLCRYYNHLMASQLPWRSAKVRGRVAEFQIDSCFWRYFPKWRDWDLQWSPLSTERYPVSLGVLLQPLCEFGAWKATSHGLHIPMPRRALRDPQNLAYFVALKRLIWAVNTCAHHFLFVVRRRRLRAAKRIVWRPLWTQLCRGVARERRARARQAQEAAAQRVEQEARRAAKEARLNEPRKCSACGAFGGRERFSRTQWHKAPRVRRCFQCVAGVSVVVEGEAVQVVSGADAGGSESSMPLPLPLPPSLSHSAAMRLAEAEERERANKLIEQTCPMCLEDDPQLYRRLIRGPCMHIYACFSCASTALSTQSYIGRCLICRVQFPPNFVREAVHASA